LKCIRAVVITVMSVCLSVYTSSQNFFPEIILLTRTQLTKSKYYSNPDWISFNILFVWANISGNWGVWLPLQRRLPGDATSEQGDNSGSLLDNRQLHRPVRALV